MKHNWEYKQLGDICDKGSSNLMQKNLEIIDNGFEVFGASGSLGKIDFYQQEAPYVGIVKDGSGVGRCNLYPAKSSLLGTMQYIIAKNCVSNEYLCYLMQSLNLSKYVNGAAIPHIYFRDYKKEIVPVPPMEVQERIVAELDKINETIEDCRELLRNLDALAQSLFYDFFGDPITNTKGWKSQTLAELCTVTSSNRIFAEEYCDEGIPFYRGKEISELSRGEKISIELFISANRYEKLKSANNVPQINDILITAVGTIGNIWVVDTLSPFYFKDGNIIWLKDINFKVSNSKYFRYLLYRLIDIEKNKMVNGSAYKALTIQNLKKLSVFLPPLSLQEKFAERIEQIETQKEAVESTIAELQTLLDSRMDYWFN